MREFLVGGNGSEVALVRYDAGNATVAWKQQVGPRPSWVHVEKSLVVVNNELDSGKVLLFRLDAGGLELLHEFDSMGADPCYMNVTSNGKFVLCANYSGGNVLAHPLVMENADSVASRQMGFSALNQTVVPHPHMAVENPYDGDSGKIYVPDLGSDRLQILALAEDGGLTVIDGLDFPVGSGPRHIAFHPKGSVAYVSLELSAELAVIQLSPLKIISSHSTTDPTLTTIPNPPISTAAVLASPDGKTVYITTRFEPTGIDSLVQFEITDDIGRSLSSTPVWNKTRGKIARGAVITSDSQVIVVANQDSDKLVFFNRQTETGLLEFVTELKVGDGFKPTCIANVC